jgi:hypothetical protein
MLVNRLFIILLLLDKWNIDVIVSRGRKNRLQIGAHSVQLWVSAFNSFEEMFEFCETEALSNNSFICGNSWWDINLEIYESSYQGA